MLVSHEVVIDGEAVAVPTKDVESLRATLLDLTKRDEPAFVTVKVGEHRLVAFLITKSTSVRIETITTPDDRLTAVPG